MLRALENAHRLLSSPERDAFDLTKEPKESFDKYNTGRFGQGCLLARRLTEAGARYIEVTTEYVPFVSWDTHENGHTTAEEMKKSIDRPIAQLILDLEERGLLDRTLVVLASEFSRDMMIEGIPGSTARDQSRAKTDVMKELKHYGLHRHFTGSGSVLLFGGGMKRGFLYGETAPERPLLTDQGSGLDHRPARDDLHRDGHLAQDGLRRRETPVLCDRGRQGRAGEGVVRVKISHYGLDVPSRRTAPGRSGGGGGLVPRPSTEVVPAWNARRRRGTESLTPQEPRSHAPQSPLDHDPDLYRPWPGHPARLRSPQAGGWPSGRCRNCSST